MRIELRILRYDPERDAKPHWESYDIEADPKLDRVLDLLHRVKYELDGSLTFRRSCGHGICGSDALLINGRNRLACKERIEKLGRRISIAPLPGLPVVKDLVVDMDGFFDSYKSVMPFFVNDGPIPERVVTKAPSAELRLNQRDSDSLPPYEVLDPIVEAYVEGDRSPEELVAAGADPAVVARVVELVDRAEYKRRQAAPGIKITPKAFGRDRRMPITNRYRPRPTG